MVTILHNSALEVPDTQNLVLIAVAWIPPNTWHHHTASFYYNYEFGKIDDENKVIFPVISICMALVKSERECFDMFIA